MANTAKLLHQGKRFLLNTRRQLYGLRSIVPGLSHRHEMEAMVGPLGFWKELQSYQMHTLCSLGLKPEHRLIDIGCGPLQGGIPCIRYLNSNGYTGIDIMPNRIRAAYNQISRHDLGEKNPRILYSESFGDQELTNDTFDFMWASQIIYNLNAVWIERLFAFISRRLKPGGKFLGDIYSSDFYLFKYPGNQSEGLTPYTVESLQELGKKHGLQVRSLGPLSDFQYPQRLGLRTNQLLEITHSPH